MNNKLTLNSLIMSERSFVHKNFIKYSLLQKKKGLVHSLQ